MQAQFGILGPLEVVVDGRRINLGGVKPRRLLAVLLVHRGEVVSVDRLVDALWDDALPGKAEVTLRAHVSGLRRALAGAGVEGAVVTRAPGYCLEVAREKLDACRFERLVDEGKAALVGGDARRAARTLREALDLWRGEVLADLDRPRFVEAEAARLDELRLVALEARVDADLALGRHREVVAELETLVDAHPFRERLCGQLMLALYRSGRQADALAACRALRRRLDEELGLAPGATLVELEKAILLQDLALAAPSERPPAEPEVMFRRPPSASAAALFEVARRVPMVGRADDLARLYGSWEAVRDGGRRVVLVSGEAGVGKTRLAAELAHRVADDKGAVVVGHCDPTAMLPYQPVTEALRGSPEVADALARAPEPIAGRLARLIERPDGSGLAVPARPDDPDTQQTAFLDAVAGLFAAMTEAAPVLFVVEDAEAIDPASARLLRHLARNLPACLLLAVCFRDPTGGNPFYAGEVVDDLAARGGINQADVAWPVPAGVLDVLRERLRALTPAAREVIACAAVLGREFGEQLAERRMPTARLVKDASALPTSSHGSAPRLWTTGHNAASQPSATTTRRRNSSPARTSTTSSTLPSHGDDAPPRAAELEPGAPEYDHRPGPKQVSRATLQ